MDAEKMSAIEEALDALEDQWVGTARARAELSSLREEIHTRGVTIDHLSAENARMREALVAARRHILCDDGCEAFKRDWIGNRFETRKCSCGADTAFDLARAALGGRDE